MANGGNLLSGRDLFGLVNEYIGVTGGYLGDFSYRSHAEFYLQFCDLDINPYELQGTTRERFIHILTNAPPTHQARIIRGILEKYPADSAPGRTRERHDHFLTVAQRLDGNIVAAPEPRATREVVLEALRDAETLIRAGRPTSAADRVHTALHGHLHALCDARGLATPKQATLNQLFNVLRTVPALQPAGQRADDISRVIRTIPVILDALNPVRNQATLAHPNEELLKDAEAMLVVNVTRSLLAYFDAKLGT